MSIDLPVETDGKPTPGPTAPRMFYLAAVLAILAMLVFLFLR